MSIPVEAVHSIHDQNSFFAFLRNQLNWPLHENIDVKDATYGWDPESIGLKPEDLRGSTIMQLRPFVEAQPWGIFFLHLQQEKLYVTELRRILRGLQPMKRKLKDHPTWNPQHVLFVCTPDWKNYTFAHFEGEDSQKAKLSTFGWEYNSDFVRTLCEFNVPQLSYPQSTDMFGLDSRTWISQWSAAFDVEKVTAEFFKKYEQVFSTAESLIKGIPGKNKEEKEENKRLYTQKLFNRLLFIRFLEKKGWLRFAEHKEYLRALWQDYRKEKKHAENFYNARLVPLFFAALNTPNEVNIIGINRGGFLGKIVGQVPYLNGGLFEKDETDENDDIVIPDEAIEPALEELFYRFNFTVTESTPLDVEVAVDPEMLGRIFEELVTRRNETGSYYTPRTVVSFMCREALKDYLAGYDRLVDEHDASDISVPEAKDLLRKLLAIKVVDPACGSGAYLLAMLHELHALIRVLDTAAKDSARDDYERKLQIIEHCVYGTDLDAFAANIAKLRLWLSLAVEFDGNNPPPLPNLDFKIEVGDSLTAPDPQDLGTFFRDQLLRQADKIAQLKGLHLREHGEEKKRLSREIRKEEQQLEVFFKDHPAPKDAFDWRVRFADVFAHEGFDVVVANPPYGLKCEDPLRFQYFPRVKGEDPQSKDSYGLFMARALQLLKPKGFFTYIVSDTWRTIRTHRPLRKLLLNKTTVLHVLDLPSWIFKATVNTCILSLRNEKALPEHRMIAGDLHNLAVGDWSTLEANLAAVAANGTDIQTNTYGQYTYLQQRIHDYHNLSFFVGSWRLYGMMTDPRFTPFAKLADVKVGLQTSDNEFYLRKLPTARGSYDILDARKLLSEEEIKSFSEGEKHEGINPADYSGKRFLPYDKGAESETEEGWLPNYHVPTEYFIDWSHTAVKRLRTATIADVKRRKGKEDEILPGDEEKLAAVIRNPEFYFRSGVTFSPTGIYSPSFRLGCAAVFGNKGSTIFSKRGDERVFLGFLCSSAARYLLKVFRSHTVETGEEVIGQLPIPQIPESEANHIRELVNAIIEKQTADPQYAYHLHEQREIDRLIYDLYGLNDKDIKEIELWYCRRYQKLAEAQGVLAEVKRKYASHLARCDMILSKPPKYWSSHPILQLIAQGESAKLEFKETLEADIKTGDKHPGALNSSLKTIAAFLNADGGTLLVGVSDGSEVKGLEKDYKLCNKHDKDGFEQKLRSLLSSRFTPAPLGNVKIDFELLPEGEVCVVEVKPMQKSDVVHLDNKEVYVRDGNVTRKLEGPDLTRWVAERAKGA